MARSKSSERWLREHFGDEFVRQAQALGLRSRAAFKLLEIDKRDRLLRQGLTVVDLGAAPGGWSQVVADRVGPRGRVVALDLLPIEPLPGVTVLQGDFTEQAVLDRLLVSLEGRPVDLVLSDMAPNMSGMKAVDQPRAALLAELALDCAGQVLRPGGDLLLKMFQGEGFDPLLADLRKAFDKVVVRKPKASRARSREVYLLARNYRLV
jgi:23S rRNA (uridine2552-2'-O)-methyltransferase